MTAFTRLAAAAVVAVAVSTPAFAGPDPDPAFQPTGILTALQGGGHVIYIRHAQTEKDYADQVTADPANCSTQRTLSEAGWHQARAIGRAFGDLKIPVGRVITSQYCRAWQTADLAFGQYRQTPALNFEPAEDYSDAQVAAMRGRVMPLVSDAPAAGVNTVIVGHDDPFEAVSGIYPEPQGVAYVLKPDGEGFAVLARIPSDGWRALAGRQID